VIGIEDEDAVHDFQCTPWSGKLCHASSQILPGTTSAHSIAMRARILFVESTADVASAVTSVLETNQFQVMRADDDRRAADRLATDHFDLLVVEVKATPDDPGLRFLRHVNTTAPHLTPRIVVISSDPPPSVQRELDAVGVCGVILKPVHQTEILQAVEECLDRTPATIQ
jgi:DNA-binding NarL/FixJ family response regulator